MLNKFVGVVCISLPLLAAAQDEPPPKEGFFGLGWLVQTQAYTSSRADALASRIDRFFGVPRSDLEAPYSALRLSTAVHWEEGQWVDGKLRLRGSVHLPALQNRLSLIFSDDAGEGTDYSDRTAMPERTATTRVNVGLNVSEGKHSRTDFRVGLRSNLHLRTSVRYRYEDDLSDNTRQRASQSLFFIDGEGFGTFTQYQLDYSNSNTQLWRWSTEMTAREHQQGVAWGSSLAHTFSQTDKQAVMVFTGLSSLSSDDFIHRYEVGLRLRRNVFRPWLFVEFTPSYRWDKLLPNQSREGQYDLLLSFEMAVGRL